MTALATTHSAVSSTGISPLQLMRRVWKAWIAWRIATATKTTLASLDDRTLRDLGLRRADIGDAVADMRCRLTDASAIPFTH